MLEWATDYFQQKGVESPRLSIEWLLAHVLDIKRLDLYLSYNRPLSPKELESLRPLVKRRAIHEPLQYITGSTEFLHTRIEVNDSVLIPRQETEQLTENILSAHPDSPPLNVLDIGTGSGCIAVALAFNRPDWQVKGIDISSTALKVAEGNARANEVSIQFEEVDINKTDSFSTEEFFDIIVSNPPYIGNEERHIVETQVREYEPAEALFVEDPIEIYKNILNLSAKHIKTEGKLYLELHDTYAERIKETIDPDYWETRIKKDYDGNKRFLICVKK